MNKEIKQILKNQREILSYILTQYPRESLFAEDVRVLIIETRDLVNPKEVVPYEDSLDVCDNCEKLEKDHPFISSQGCDEFVKSSKGEGK